MAEISFFKSLHAIKQARGLSADPREILARFRAELRDLDVQRELLRLLGSPSWIQPLVDYGLLGVSLSSADLSPAQERLTLTGLGFLQRVATEAPADVAAVTLLTPLDSAERLGSAIQIAGLLPGALATELAVRILAAVDADIPLRISDGAALLVANLCKAGQSDLALRLLTSLSQLHKLSNRQAGPRRIDEHRLFALLKQTVPVLLRFEPKNVLALLLNMLEMAVEAKGAGRTDPLDDLSFMWRPAIEEHKQNRTFDFAGSLVDPVRDAIEQAVLLKQITASEAIEFLEGRKYLIFRRLRLHVIAEFGHELKDVACDAMLNHSIFVDHRFKHEYARLVGHRFDLLSETGRSTFLQWIEAGPNLENFRESFASHQHRAPKPEEEHARVNYWQYERLWWIRDHITGKWAGIFANMRKKYGDPEMPDLNVRISARFGAESPIPPDALKGKGIAEIVQYLNTWEPDPQFAGPSREGLSGTLARIVGESPDRFATGAMLFRGAAPIFVRTLIDAVRTAVEQDKPLDLNPILELCEWVVGQPANENDDEINQGLQGERGWQYTRDAVARFAEALCKKKVPLEYRDRIWSVLPSLTADSDRSYVIDADTKDDLRKHDFTTQSLNTPRSRAIHSIIEYARWVHDHLESRGDPVRDFQAMPEVREILERQLEPPRSRSFAVRSTFGWWFIPLYVIDRGWMTRNASRIFDLSGTATEPSAGWAAWNTYLIAHQIYDETYQVLKAQYQNTVDVLPELLSDEEPGERPLGAMAEHLISLYGRGTLTFESDGAVVRRLFENSNGRLRSHAVTFVGRSLMGYENLEAEVRERFIRLWEWYWSRWGRSADANVLTGYEFGTWAGSSAFDASWTLRQLREFAEVQPKVEPDNYVMEYVAKVFTANPADAVRFVELFVRGDTENWRVYGSEDEIYQILRQAMQAESGTSEAAVQVIDYLGRRGHLKFGDLLPSPAPL